ncbi:hypothetical protein [Zhouia amylolytica]|uniref:hypothetical protein n=1 Tax=Zhouia amylolytica TaxID=376730 RepID=UPI0020CC34DF|nr:hypothetical protein [Zhouia amylolytica]MCQ0110858.1 hypothetical protein [Zhouia amylolytica]
MKTFIYALFSFICAFMIYGCDNDDDDNGNMTSQLPDNLPDVNNATFSNSTSITNNLYGPPANEIYIYEGGEVGMEPEEEIILERRTSTREVMGVICIIQNDRVYVDDILIEDTDDWLAQDDDGNLWYFGEIASNYDDEGNFEDNEGSWESGVDDALAGYWLPANPIVGQKYYQEWYEDEAEDQAEVIAIGETVTIEIGTYENCIVTKDFTLLEPDEYELKYYAPGIGLIKEEKYEDEELTEIVELIEIIEK